MRLIATAIALCLWMSTPALAQTAPTTNLSTDDIGLSNDNALPSDADAIDAAGGHTPVNPLQATIDADRKAITDAENAIDQDWTLRHGKAARKRDEKALNTAKNKLENDLKACNLVSGDGQAKPPSNNSPNPPACR